MPNQKNSKIATLHGGSKTAKCNVFFRIIFFIPIIYFISCDLDVSDPSKEQPKTISAPKNLNATSRTNYVSLDWSDVPEASSFEIYCGLNKNYLVLYATKSKISSSPTSQSVSSTSSLVSSGNMYFFAVKANGPNGLSEFSQIVSAFLPPASTSEMYSYPPYSSIGTSSSNHKTIATGATQWYKISISESVDVGKNISLYVLNQKKDGSSNQIANVTSKYFRNDGTEFSSSFVIDKLEYIFCKVTATTGGEYRLYYTKE